MKRLATEMPNLKRDSVSGVYYYRKGKVELSLKTTVWEIAISKHKLLSSTVDDIGTLAYRHKVNDLYKEYLSIKTLQSQGKLKKTKSIGVRTLEEIEGVFRRHLIPFFGNKKLSDCNERLWERYCAQAPVSDLTNHRKAFSGFLKWCKVRGYLKYLPDITAIPLHHKRQRRIVKPEEIREIFSRSKGNLLLFLSIALFMGFRRKEIMTLKWRNVSFLNRSLLVEGVDNKMGRSREVPANTIVLSLLKAKKDELTAKGIGTPWVFPNANDPSRHAAVCGLKTAWHKVLRDAKLVDITWHDFRATYEKYAHKSTGYTDTQKEKFSDSSMDVQKRIYVSMDADDLRGLENVVKVEGLDVVFAEKIKTLGENAGKA